MSDNLSDFLQPVKSVCVQFSCTTGAEGASLVSMNRRKKSAVSRREFLVSTALAASAVGCKTIGTEAFTEIIDTHTHFYDPTRPEGVPWPPKNDSVLYRRVLPTELKEIAIPL